MKHSVLSNAVMPISGSPKYMKNTSSSSGVLRSTSTKTVAGMRSTAWRDSRHAASRMPMTQPAASATTAMPSPSSNPSNSLSELRQMTGQLKL